MERNAPITAPSFPQLTVVWECSTALDLWTTWDVLQLTLVLLMERLALSTARMYLLWIVEKG
jgi:hypothetical protein